MKFITLFSPDWKIPANDGRVAVIITFVSRNEKIAVANTFKTTKQTNVNTTTLLNIKDNYVTFGMFLKLFA